MLRDRERVRVGVVGVGYLGQFHVEKYVHLPEVELVGVVDIDRARAGEVAGRFGTEAFYHWGDLLGEVDAVSISAPTQFHYEIAKGFLKEGVDVLLEKPMTTTLEEAEELIREGELSGAILQVGHLERFNSAILALDGVVENPMFIESHRLAPFTERGTDVDVVLDLMIHDIDIILNLVKSEIKGVDAVGVPVITKEVDIANARIRFESGCVADVTASRVSRERMRKIRLFQPDTYISIDYAAQKVAVLKRVPGVDGGMPGIVEEELVVEKGDPLEGEIKAFLEAVITRKEPLVTGRDGKRALEVALKIREGLGYWVKGKGY